MKYPLLRLGHFPETILKHKLYLDFTGKREPRYHVPDSLPIPEHSVRPVLPIVQAAANRIAAAVDDPGSPAA
jgi:hypothetical protein